MNTRFSYFAILFNCVIIPYHNTSGCFHAPVKLQFRIQNQVKLLKLLKSGMKKKKEINVLY
jgi:hypothetical protein